MTCYIYVLYIFYIDGITQKVNATLTNVMANVFTFRMRHSMRFQVSNSITGAWRWDQPDRVPISDYSPAAILLLSRLFFLFFLWFILTASAITAKCFFATFQLRISIKFQLMADQTRSKHSMTFLYAGNFFLYFMH